MKKLICAILALCMVLALCACTAPAPQPTEAPRPTETAAPTEAAPATDADLRTPAGAFHIGALKGPTSMGLVKLMADMASEELPLNDYSFTLAGAADELTPKFLKGEMDMICVPANLASVLYNKTEGQVVVLAVNTLGVLYIVEKGETVTSLEDLKGRTIVAAGKGSTPEYALRYLLTENGIDPDNDVTIDWKSEHSECVAALASDAAAIALLPQPFVTVAGTKVDGLRIALDLNAEWDALDNGSALITGVIVTRPDVIEAQGKGLDLFLADYALSVDWVNTHTEEAAALIGSYDIVAEAVARQALPYCNIVCIQGSLMKNNLEGYLQVLFDADPASVGGSLPGADFYYHG